MKTGLKYFVAALMLLAPAALQADDAPDFSLPSASGETVSLSDFRGKTVVLEWSNHGCPFVRKHYESGNMQALQQDLTGEDVVWLTIISSAPGEQGHVSAAQAQALTSQRGAHPTHVLLDPDGTVGNLYRARTTPHMYMITGEGSLVYQGAIDDKPSARPASLDGAHNYVRAAWQSVKAGEPVAVSSTKPYGCTVKYAG